MVDKDDPSHGVFEEVARWNNTVACLPTWNEILEIEYVRERGEVNMFTDNVAQHCFDHGLFNAATWYERCRVARIHPFQLYSQAVSFYEAEHGPCNAWITDDIRNSFEDLEIAAKEMALRHQARQLRAKRRRAVKKRARRG